MKLIVTHRFEQRLRCWCVPLLSLALPLLAISMSADDGLAPPALIEGILPNNFRYLLLRHARGTGHISLQFVVQAGSLDERDEERGDAHFVEHMAVGSAETPTTETPAYPFGISAFTHFSFTQYLIELDANQTPQLSRALLQFRKFADGVEFTADKVAAQRRVVRREFHTTKTLAQRVYVERLAATYAGSGLPDRLPKGLLERIEDATPERLHQFYLRCYHPDRMTLAVVGDIDPVTLVPLVEKTFGTLRPADVTSAPVQPRLITSTPLHSKVIVTPAQDHAEAALIAIPPLVLGGDTVGQRETEFAEAVIVEVLGRRLAIADATLGPSTGGQSEPPDPHFREYSFVMQALPGDWTFLASRLAAEARRLREEEIPAPELAGAVAAQLASWRAKRDGFADEPAAAVMASITNAITTGRSWLPPARYCAEAEGFLAQFTPPEALAAAQNLLREEAICLVLTVPTAPDGGEAALLAASREGVSTPRMK